jgi:hypothetical protein
VLLFRSVALLYFSAPPPFSLALLCTLAALLLPGALPFSLAAAPPWPAAS